MKKIGVSFGEELRVAGLGDVIKTWHSDGRVEIPEGISKADLGTLDAVLKAHDPERPAKKPTKDEAINALLAANGLIVEDLKARLAKS